jgi:hypothetical protein
MRRKPSKKLATGQKVRDVQDRSVGVVLDCACQYAHPKAQPVYSYLIRWQDGQVQAVSEAAFHGDGGLEPID